MSEAIEPEAEEAEEKVITEVFKSLHAKVRVIRERRRLSIPQVFEKFCGPAIDREYRKVVKEMHDELHPADTTTGGA